MNEIERYVSEKKYSEALNTCLVTNHNNLGKLLSFIISDKTNISGQFQRNINGITHEGKVINVIEENVNSNNENMYELTNDTDKSDKVIRVKVLCNWASPSAIRDNLNIMSQGCYKWNNIKLVLDDDPDYFVVINSPLPGDKFIPEKTIIFHMEPYMDTNNKNLWGEWANPDPAKFFKVYTHKVSYNNIIWHLSTSYSDLQKMTIVKDEKYNNIISTVLSCKYQDPGHIKRIDFVKFLEKNNVPVHVYGDNKWDYKDYKGGLPYGVKDKGMFPYKYVFNCENNDIKNYFTEKLVDGILAECLVFYSGCYNISEFIDERAYVRLELSNFEEDCKKVQKAIEDNLWEQRLPYIKESKRKILEYLQFFPRLERILTNNEDKEYETVKNST